MTEIQGKSILVRVNARFELARVQVIGSQLYMVQKGILKLSEQGGFRKMRGTFDSIFTLIVQNHLNIALLNAF